MLILLNEPLNYLTGSSPFLFLIYINDWSDNLQFNPKLFADDTSLFSTAKVPERTANNLNNKQKEINVLSSRKSASSLN